MEHFMSGEVSIDLEVENRVNDMIKRGDLKDKVVFWDIDGTLATYRFNGHIGDPDGTAKGQSLSEIDDGVFEKRETSKLMQRIVRNCKSKTNIIMGHTVKDKEINDKNIWLDREYPNIGDRIFLTCVK